MCQSNDLTENLATVLEGLNEKRADASTSCTLGTLRRILRPTSQIVGGKVVPSYIQLSNNMVHGPFTLQDAKDTVSFYLLHPDHTECVGNRVFKLEPSFGKDLEALVLTMTGLKALSQITHESGKLLFEVFINRCKISVQSHPYFQGIRQYMWNRRREYVRSLLARSEQQYLLYQPEEAARRQLGMVVPPTAQPTNNLGRVLASSANSTALSVALAVDTDRGSVTTGSQPQGLISPSPETEPTGYLAAQLVAKTTAYLTPRQRKKAIRRENTLNKTAAAAAANQNRRLAMGYPTSDRVLRSMTARQLPHDTGGSALHHRDLTLQNTRLTQVAVLEATPRPAGESQEYPDHLSLWSPAAVQMVTKPEPTPRVVDEASHGAPGSTKENPMVID